MAQQEVLGLKSKTMRWEIQIACICRAADANKFIIKNPGAKETPKDI
jgi:hypothetical protein